MIARTPGKPSGHGWRRPATFFVVVILCISSQAVIAASPAPGGQRRAPEEDVKAAFLYNFAQLVEWPSDSPQRNKASLNLGVWADKERSRRVARIVQGKQVDGRPIVVRVMHDIGALQDCQILLIPSSVSGDTAEVLDAVRDSPILTVGESESFSASGGIILFKIVDDRVRFEINIESATRSRLRVSSKLLRVAEIVGLGERPNR